MRPAHLWGNHPMHRPAVPASLLSFLALPDPALARQSGMPVAKAARAPGATSTIVTSAIVTSAIVTSTIMGAAAAPPLCAGL